MNAKEHFFIFSLIFFIAASVVYGGLWFFVRAEISHIQTTQETIEQVRVSEESLIELQALLRRTEAERAELDHYFIGSEDVVAFLEQVEAFAETTDVELSISSVTLGSEIKDESEEGKDALLEELIITVSASGEFEDVFHFVSVIETLPFRTRFKQLSLNHVSGDSETEVWELLTIFSALKFK